MKKFVFRLESVRKFREQKEHEALRYLSEAKRLLIVETEKKDSLVREMNESRVRLENLGKQPTGINNFQLEQDFINGSRKRIEQAVIAIKRAERTVEKATEYYLHTKKNKEILEVLKEKEIEKFRKEKIKHETKEMNDLYVIRSKKEEAA